MYIPKTLSKMLTGTLRPTYTITKVPQSIKNIERESKLKKKWITILKLHQNLTKTWKLNLSPIFYCNFNKKHVKFF